MRNNSNEMSTGTALLITLGIMFFIGFIISASEPKCSMSGCDKDAKEDGRYCYLHDLSYWTYGNPDYNAVYENSQKKKESYASGSSTKSNSSGATTSGSFSTATSDKTSTSKSTGNSTKKHSSYSAYDEGYEDVYDNDDYDWDRYRTDSDYADGVDDAMEDEEW